VNGWIGVDLDGTLAHYDRWVSAIHIGPPVSAMRERVMGWLDEGRDVRIFTARVYSDGDPGRQRQAAVALIAIQEWCVRHLGKVLPVTCTKDFGMIELWDDRCVQVRQNTGEKVGESTRGLD
jgi:hypothetical protein